MISNSEFGTTAGVAVFFSIQAWASDNETIDMVVTIGREVGLNASGRIHVHSTEPQQPPLDAPHAYGLNFHQYVREI
ncbi:hypothetical protein HJA95_01070 [Rhizobium binae]|uniref:hypothetical protein n=1 Tax=Rhizobium binae TaxID=1138190 RepID=UPI001C82FD2F|nr:hypothetical protein [Rhizobium binae]MBX4948215.1 hypothetical protein [Rhizobium binae]